MEEITSNIGQEREKEAPITSSVNSLKPKDLPIENIQVITKDSTESNELVEKIISAEKIETVFDKNATNEQKKKDSPEKAEPVKLSEITNEKTEESTSKNVSNESTIEDVPASLRSITKTIIEKRRIGSASSGFVSEKINRNQSDIFSLKDETTIASSIFSVNGSPSRKVYRKVQKVPSSNVFPFGQMAEPLSDQLTTRDRMRDKDSYHDVKRPTSSLRNPLTGTGLNSNDEYKFKGKKRLDGNPLLGLGYTPEATPSTHRIPPGGYSHKLW